ncbi:MAG: hypothetical protein JNM27_09670 [Leptospirales bacterium]|nr:hypothetical protein [Leptospirales bacterium]
MFLPDLSPYSYGREIPGVQAVGWLSEKKSFPVGTVNAETLHKIRALAIDTRWNVMRGTHQCEICGPGGPGCNSELAVPDRARGIVYSAPSLITHYIEAHGYRPPDEFLEAVEAAPGFLKSWRAQGMMETAQTLKCAPLSPSGVSQLLPVTRHGQGSSFTYSWDLVFETINLSSDWEYNAPGISFRLSMPYGYHAYLEASVTTGNDPHDVIRHLNDALTGLETLSPIIAVNLALRGNGWTGARLQTDEILPTSCAFIKREQGEILLFATPFALRNLAAYVLGGVISLGLPCADPPEDAVTHLVLDRSASHSTDSALIEDSSLVLQGDDGAFSRLASSLRNLAQGNVDQDSPFANLHIRTLEPEHSYIRVSTV